MIINNLPNKIQIDINKDAALIASEFILIL